MEYKKWNMYYRRILSDFGFERTKDESCARLLSHIMTKEKRHPAAAVRGLYSLVGGSDVFVFGCADTLEEDVKNFAKRWRRGVDWKDVCRKGACGPRKKAGAACAAWPVCASRASKEAAKMHGKGAKGNARKAARYKKPVVIAADGATERLLSRGVMPDIIVTDLDGDVKSQIRANRGGAVAVIHAHGDNLAAIKRWLPRFWGPVIGTAQSAPLHNVYNFGGFTDGDRSVFLAQEFGASSITLLGFDYETVGGAKSLCGKERGMKLRKLQWAKKLIDNEFGELTTVFG